MSNEQVQKMTEKIPPESCFNCRYALGPASMPVLQCGCAHSAFFGGPVAHDGWCDQFDPPEASTPKDRKE